MESTSSSVSDSKIANNSKIFIISKVKKQKNWTSQEDSILLQLSQNYGQKAWNKVSAYFDDKSASQCRARYKRIRPGIVKGSWTPEEDYQIISLINKVGKNWALISRHMPSRNGKQIRDRYINYLDTQIIREKFSAEEDKLIIDNYLNYGPKWSVIAKYIEGRTADMIKNRFYSSLRRKVHVHEVMNVDKKIKNIPFKPQVEPVNNDFSVKKTNTNNLQNDNNIRNGQVFANEDSLNMTQQLNALYLNHLRNLLMLQENYGINNLYGLLNLTG